jgi:hypothetical protein
MSRRRLAGFRRHPIPESGSSGTHDEMSKKGLLGSLTIGGKVLLGTVVTAVITSLVGLFFTSYGPRISDVLNTHPPVQVLVQDQADPTVGGVVYALRGGLPSRPPHVTVGPQLATIVRDRGAAQVDELALKLILRGQRSRPVVITNIRARIVEREEPLRGTLLVAPSQGAYTSIDGCVHLAGTKPAMLASDRGVCVQSSRPYFDGHYLTLDSGEQLVINLEIIANDTTESARPSGGGYYEFELVLDAVVDGEPAEIPVRNGAETFRLTSYAPHYSAIYLAKSDDLRILNSVDPKVYCRPSCSGGINRP